MWSWVPDIAQLAPAPEPGRNSGMTSAGDLGEVGDVEGGGADLGQQCRRFSRSAGVVAR